MIISSRILRCGTILVGACAAFAAPTSSIAAKLAHVIPATFTITVDGNNYTVPTSISVSRGVLTGQLDLTSFTGNDDKCIILPGSTDRRGILHMLCKEADFRFTLGLSGTLNVKNGEGSGIYTCECRSNGTYTSAGVGRAPARQFGPAADQP